jgi:putative ABC transport system permease protein
MPWTQRVARRLTQWLRRDRTEAELDAELRDHLEREIADRMAQGASRAEAMRLAFRDFGGVERFKEEARDVLGLRLLDDVGRDARYAWRLLRRNVGFTIAVVLTFALGIGCTSAIFTLVDGILLRPLPYAQPGRLVALWERNGPRAVDRNVVSVDAFERWRDRARSFTDVVAMVPAPRTLQGNPAERITGAQVSAAYFRLLGVHPAIGRDFTNADELNGGASVAILSDAFWRSRFGADASIVGRAIVMDGTSYTVVGVMPPQFEAPRFGWMTEDPLWIPFAATADNRKWGRFLHVIARLRPGMTIEEARTELVTLSERAAAESADRKDWSATVVPLDEQITGNVRRPLLTLFGAVALLLLLSIVNVVNLVTTFTRRRQHVTALRRAIGATRWRLFRQQLTLSLVLGALAAAIGLGVALVATRGLMALMPPDVPRLAGTRVNDTVILFVLGVSCLTTLVVAWQSTVRGVPRFGAGLELGASRTTGRLDGARLVTAEIAIGLVLSVLAVLMVRSFVKLADVDLGFQPAQVAVARVSLPSDRYATDARQRQFFDALVGRVRALPGVSTASVATTSPFACCAPATTARDAARADDPRAPAPTVDVRFVDTTYFSALAVSRLAGRVFAPNEPASGPPRAVISRALARALWGNADPLGRRVSLVLFGTTTAEVIGVVEDVRYGDARTPARPAAYLSTNRYPSSERDVIVRGSGDASALVGQLRVVLASLDPAIPLYRATPLARVVDQTLAPERFVTALLSAFALLALSLAVVGVHGVLSGDVTRRRKEIGIRAALGATPAVVYQLVLRRALVPALEGVAIGLATALLISRALSALVFGIATWDPASFLLVTAGLTIVALGATWMPAFRAGRVSPVEAIKTD